MQKINETNTYELAVEEKVLLSEAFANYLNKKGEKTEKKYYDPLDFSCIDEFQNQYEVSFKDVKFRSKMRGGGGYKPFDYHTVFATTKLTIDDVGQIIGAEVISYEKRWDSHLKS